MAQAFFFFPIPIKIQPSDTQTSGSTNDQQLAQVQ